MNKKSKSNKLRWRKIIARWEAIKMEMDQADPADSSPRTPEEDYAIRSFISRCLAGVATIDEVEEFMK